MNEPQPIHESRRAQFTVAIRALWQGHWPNVPISPEFYREFMHAFETAYRAGVEDANGLALFEGAPPPGVHPESTGAEPD